MAAEWLSFENVWTCHYVVWNRAARGIHLLLCSTEKKESCAEFLHSEVDFYIQSPEIEPSLNPLTSAHLNLTMCKLFFTHEVIMLSC